MVLFYHHQLIIYSWFLFILPFLPLFQSRIGFSNNCKFNVLNPTGEAVATFTRNCWADSETLKASCYSVTDMLTKSLLQFEYDYDGSYNALCKSAIGFDSTDWTAISRPDSFDTINGNFLSPSNALVTKGYFYEAQKSYLLRLYLTCSDSSINVFKFNSSWCLTAQSNLYCMLMEIPTESSPQLCSFLKNGASFCSMNIKLLNATTITLNRACWYDLEVFQQQRCFLVSSLYNIYLTYPEGAINTNCTNTFSFPSVDWELILAPDGNNDETFTTPFPSLRLSAEFGFVRPNSPVFIYLTCSTDTDILFYYNISECIGSCVRMTIPALDSPNVCEYLASFSSNQLTLPPTGTPILPIICTLNVIDTSGNKIALNRSCWNKPQTNNRACFLLTDESDQSLYNFQYADAYDVASCPNNIHANFLDWALLSVPDTFDGIDGFSSPSPALVLYSVWYGFPPAELPLRLYLQCSTNSSISFSFDSNWCRKMNNTLCVKMFIPSTTSPQLCSYLDNVVKVNGACSIQIYQPELQSTVIFFKSCWIESLVSTCFNVIDANRVSSFTFEYDYEGMSNLNCNDRLRFYSKQWTPVTSPDRNNGIGGFVTPFPSVLNQAAWTPTSSSQFEVIMHVYLVCNAFNTPFAFNSTWCVENCMIMTITPEDSPDLCQFLSDFISIPTSTPILAPSLAPPFIYPQCYLVAEELDERKILRHKCWYEGDSLIQECFESLSLQHYISFTYDYEGKPNPSCSDGLIFPTDVWTIVRTSDILFSTPYPALRIQAVFGDLPMYVYVLSIFTVEEFLIIYDPNECGVDKRCLVIYLPYSESFEIYAYLSNIPVCTLSIITPDDILIDDYSHSCWLDQSSGLSSCFSAKDAFGNENLQFYYNFEGTSNDNCESGITFSRESWDLVTINDFNNNIGSTPFITPYPSIRTSATDSNRNPTSVYVYIVCSAERNDVTRVRYESTWCLNGCVVITLSRSDAPELCLFLDTFVMNTPTGVPFTIPTISPTRTIELGCGFNVLLNDGDETLYLPKDCFLAPGRDNYRKCFTTTPDDAHFAFDFEKGARRNPFCDSRLVFDSNEWVPVYAPDENIGINGFFTPFPSIRTINAYNLDNFFPIHVYIVCGLEEYAFYNKTQCHDLHCMLILNILYDSYPQLCMFLKPQCSLIVQSPFQANIQSYNHSCWTELYPPIQRCFYSESAEFELAYSYEGIANTNCSTAISFPTNVWTLILAPDENDGINEFSTPYPSIRIDATWIDHALVRIYVVCAYTNGPLNGLYFNYDHCYGFCAILYVPHENSELCLLLDNSQDYYSPTEFPSFLGTSTPTIDQGCDITVFIDQYDFPFSVCFLEDNSRMRKCFTKGDLSFSFDYFGQSNPQCSNVVTFPENKNFQLITAPDGNNKVGGFITPYPSVKITASWMRSRTPTPLTVYIICDDSDGIFYNSAWCGDVIQCAVVRYQRVNAWKLCATIENVLTCLLTIYDPLTDDTLDVRHYCWRSSGTALQSCFQGIDLANNSTFSFSFPFEGNSNSNCGDKRVNFGISTNSWNLTREDPEVDTPDFNAPFPSLLFPSASYFDDDLHIYLVCSTLPTPIYFNSSQCGDHKCLIFSILYSDSPELCTYLQNSITLSPSIAPSSAPIESPTSNPTYTSNLCLFDVRVKDLGLYQLMHECWYDASSIRKCFRSGTSSYPISFSYDYEGTYNHIITTLI